MHTWKHKCIRMRTLSSTDFSTTTAFSGRTLVLQAAVSCTDMMVVNEPLSDRKFSDCAKFGCIQEKEKKKTNFAFVAMFIP